LYKIDGRGKKIGGEKQAADDCAKCCSLKCFKQNENGGRPLFSSASHLSAVGLAGEEARDVPLWPGKRLTWQTDSAEKSLLAMVAYQSRKKNG
jgi:hypothetical protein